MIQELYERVVGSPFVYERIRPWLVGGIDNSCVWRELGVGSDDVVLDVGCGTGDALAHLTEFKSYHGFDTDPRAVRYARTRAKDRPHTHFIDRRVEADDIERIKPTRVMLSGLLHHLSDDDAAGLFALIAKAKGVRRVTTLDPTYVSGKYVNNVLTFLDRGKFVRDTRGYQLLAERAGFTIDSTQHVRSHPIQGRAYYVLMGLSPSHPHP